MAKIHVEEEMVYDKMTLGQGNGLQWMQSH
jgi:hypothetical protein